MRKGSNLLLEFDLQLRLFILRHVHQPQIISRVGIEAWFKIALYEEVFPFRDDDLSLPVQPIIEYSLSNSFPSFFTLV